MQVIDAEIERRKLLEDTPVASLREDPVNFDTSEIPWWAWVRRFHLPEVSPICYVSSMNAAIMRYCVAWCLVGCTCLPKQCQQLPDL